LEEIATAGYRIVNVDTVLVLAAPKIGPLAGDIRARVAELLHLEPSDVGIKAKTPEGLNQDGVAVAQVVVLLEPLAAPGELAQMTAEVDSEAEIESVLRELSGESGMTRALGRKKAFDTDDLT
jgi:2-C-methyl-D-erythritol 2,4-cyclodiphosphate synthase